MPSAIQLVWSTAYVAAGAPTKGVMLVKRIVTAVGPNYFVSEPYEKKIAEVEIEEIKPAKTEEKVIRRRGKKEK